MSKLTDLLATVGVRNEHAFYNGRTPAGRVFITWTGSGGRSPIGFYWTIRDVGGLTDDRPADTREWYSNGNRIFHALGDKAEALAQAQEWASIRYGITEWKRDPFGSYGDATFVSARLAALKDQAKMTEAAVAGGDRVSTPTGGDQVSGEVDVEAYLPGVSHGGWSESPRPVTPGRGTGQVGA